MLNNYIDNLQNSIQWAQYQDDIDILCLARDQMDQLAAYITTLPEAEQQQINQQIDHVLPMEWPLWMEACRYQDGEHMPGHQVTLH